MVRIRWTEFKYVPYTDQLIEKKLSDGKRYVYTPHAVHRDLVDRVEVWETQGEGQILAYWRQNVYYPATWRLWSTTTPEGTITYEYTDEGQLKRTTTSTGLDVHYTYDVLGNLKTVTSKQLSASGAEPKTVTYLYDGATGRRTGIVNPNGTSTDYEYHARGWVRRITHKRGATILMDMDYTRDDRGLITGVVETREGGSVATWTYGYDDAQRLTNAVRTSNVDATLTYAYTYDNGGNRLTQNENGVTTTYTYNSLDQLVSDGTTTYEWDIFGGRAVRRVLPTQSIQKAAGWARSLMNEHSTISRSAAVRALAFSERLIENSIIIAGKNTEGADIMAQTIDGKLIAREVTVFNSQLRPDNLNFRDKLLGELSQLRAGRASANADVHDIYVEVTDAVLSDTDAERRLIEMTESWLRDVARLDNYHQGLPRVTIVNGRRQIYPLLPGR